MCKNIVLYYVNFEVIIMDLVRLFQTYVVETPSYR